MSELETYFAIAGAVVSGVVWCIRLEGKVKAQDRLLDAQDKRISLLQEKHESLDSKIMDELSCIRESLARLEGRLDFRGNKGST